MSLLSRLHAIFDPFFEPLFQALALFAFELFRLLFSNQLTFVLFRLDFVGLDGFFVVFLTLNVGIFDLFKPSLVEFEDLFYRERFAHR